MDDHVDAFVFSSIGLACFVGLARPASGEKPRQTGISHQVQPE